MKQVSGYGRHAQESPLPFGGLPAPVASHDHCNLDPRQVVWNILCDAESAKSQAHPLRIHEVLAELKEQRDEGGLRAPEAHDEIE